MTANGQMKMLYMCLLAILISGSACTQQSPARPSSPADSQSSDSTIDRVCRITAELLNVDASSVTAATSLDELGADELDFVELVMEIEEEFDISISDEAIENVTGTDNWQVGMKKVTMEKLAAIVDDQK